MVSVSRIVLPTIIGLSVYSIISRFFPEEIEVFKEDLPKDVRGGSQIELTKWITRRITKKLLKDKALKLAILSIFATAGIQYFQSEIEALLVDDVFKHLCGQKVDGELKVVCDIIQEHELNLHTKSIRSLIISNNLGREEKISLLKIKFDFIINGECAGKRRFFIMAVLGAVVSVAISGVGGLALILEALYRLFQEGKISKALYKQILKALAKRGGVSLPVEHFLD
jgi:hypothetical protein